MTVRLDPSPPRKLSESSPEPEQVGLSLTRDPIGLLTRRIAIPASVGYFFNTMFNLVDTYSAGLLSTDALAALSLSFPVFFLLLAMGGGLSQGATALVANALGAGDREGARRIFVQAEQWAERIGVEAADAKAHGDDLLHAPGWVEGRPRGHPLLAFARLLAALEC